MAAGLSKEARTLLASEPQMAHLATCGEGGPHVAPVWYHVHDDYLEVAVTGRKLANLRVNPRVALSVQQDEDGDPIWGVSVQGTARIVEDETTAGAVVRRINRRYGAADDAWIDNTAVEVEVGTSSAWRY